MQFSIKTLLIVMLLIAACTTVLKYRYQKEYLVANVRLDNDYSVRFIVEYRPDDTWGDYYYATIYHKGDAHRPMGMICRDPEFSQTSSEPFYSPNRQFVVVPTPGNRYHFICGDLSRGFFVEMDEMIRNYETGITLPFWLDAVNEVVAANPNSGIRRIDY